MKIGILTRRYGFNMGSTLQAFAMSDLAKRFSDDVEIIDYDESSAHPLWKLRPMVEHIQYRYFKPILHSKRTYLYHRITQENKFHKFEQLYLPLSEEKVSSSKSLTRLAKKYDKILIGSDQIWSPFLFDRIFFGAFLPTSEKTKAILYAPSIGTSNTNLISHEQKDLIRGLVAISCREEAGAKIINRITGKDIPVVLDPTLMVIPEKWDIMADASKVSGLPDQYVLTYFLGKNAHQRELEIFASEHSAKIVNVAMFNKANDVKPYINIYDAGPSEFLYLIKNASGIATDSYHATIFSWIFRKDFKIFQRFKSGDPRNQNSRIDTLVKTLGCESKLAFSGLMDSSGNFDDAKNTSLDFLRYYLH